MPYAILIIVIITNIEKTMIKYSKQRETILNNLTGRRDHPTADMVYESVKQTIPNISLGTVYRNLSLLAENGQILRIQTGIGPDRFDGFIKPHSHFVCKQCGKVYDMDYVPNKSIITKASELVPGTIEEADFQFYGTCNDCIILTKKN